MASELLSYTSLPQPLWQTSPHPPYEGVLAVLWIALLVLTCLVLALGAMLKQTRDELSAQSAKLASLQLRAKKDAESLKAEHEKTLDRHHRHADQQLQGAHLPLARSLFEGLDALDMALKNSDASKEDLLSGIAMVQRSFTKALAAHDVTPISPTPRQDPFDPELHEAIAVVEHADLPDKTVESLLRTGWTHTSKVLRPAMVQTSKVVHISNDDEPTTLDFSSPHDEQEEEVDAPQHEEATARS